MLDRFTDRAKRVLALGVRTAQSLRHDHVGPEHLLWGLAEDGAGVAVTVLTTLGAGPERLLAELRQRMEPGTAEVPPDQLQQSEPAQALIARACKEADQLSHHFIGTEHLLLAVLAEGDGVASLALDALNIEPDQIRQGIFRMIAAETSGAARPRPTPGHGPVNTGEFALAAEVVAAWPNLPGHVRQAIVSLVRTRG